jgi:hypothetical protein
VIFVKFYSYCCYHTIWAKNIVSITMHKPEPVMNIWVHIIENENQGYRKRD